MECRHFGLTRLARFRAFVKVLAQTMKKKVFILSKDATATEQKIMNFLQVTASSVEAAARKLCIAVRSRIRIKKASTKKSKDIYSMKKASAKESKDMREIKSGASQVKSKKKKSKAKGVAIVDNDADFLG